MGFGEHLRRLRQRKSFTIRQLAMLSGVSNAYLSQIETGQRGAPSPEILDKLAKPLGVSYEDLLRVAGYLRDTPKDWAGQKPASVIARDPRTDEYEDDLPEEAKKELEQYKNYLRHKYRRKE
ncbi:MAG: transcriptional regulator [Firmicutes bacterium]|nr:transcriptional regulator [Bacillota bacterium]